MPDDNYFDSEKAFKEAVEPSRRAFLKKISMIGAAAVAAAKALPAAPVVPEMAPPVPELHIRSMGVDVANYGAPVYSTMSIDMHQYAYTCLPTYSWDPRAWVPYEPKKG